MTGALLRRINTSPVNNCDLRADGPIPKLRMVPQDARDCPRENHHLQSIFGLDRTVCSLSDSFAPMDFGYFVTKSDVQENCAERIRME